MEVTLQTVRRWWWWWQRSVSVAKVISALLKLVHFLQKKKKKTKTQFAQENRQLAEDLCRLRSKCFDRLMHPP